ncbi:MAG: DUF2193 domain-containing protein [Methanobacterium sp.]|nr:DUF2193 domain-containing protein [Methanobacterium sp.]
MVELYEKMVQEAMMAQKADVETVKNKRGTPFHIKATKAYLDVVQKMEATAEQSESVINLHVNSVKAHYHILDSLTDTIRPEDDPFVEHYQTPVVLEILCDEDPEFEGSLSKFIEAIGKAEALIGKEVVRRYGGFYGPTCVVDFALMPGSTSNTINRIVKTVDIPLKHKQAILSAKSWGTNTSYGIGEVFCKDDVTMAIIEATTDVMDSTLKQALPDFKSEYEVLSLATGSSACAVEYILELDGFNAPTVVDLLTKRLHNYVQLYPTRGAAAELHNSDFMDMIYRGWGHLDQARKALNGSSGTLTPKVAGFKVDLEPVHQNEVIMNPQRYTYPACAITVRFSSLMRLADYPCLLTSEPVTATLMTNIIALHKESPASPARTCKNCAAASLVDFRHNHCQWKEAV